MSGAGSIYEYQRELTAKLDQLIQQRDEARAFSAELESNVRRLARERDEARAARDHFKEQLRERAEALLDARAEVERLRADLSYAERERDRWMGQVVAVAERQREACAAAVDAHGIRSEWGTVVRATPLVTEVDK